MTMRVRITGPKYRGEKMKIGFVGLGNVGGKLAGSLLRNGKDLTVLDLNPDFVSGFVARGAKAADSPAGLMRDCDVVITCLPSPAASVAVVSEMLGWRCPRRMRPKLNGWGRK